MSGPDPQNIYDDPEFFTGYSQLERFGAGWHQAMEHADLLALLPPVRGRRVLDLGCGAGQLAHHLATAGAAEVVGVDVSERMLAVARTGWAHPHVTYVRASMEDAAFPAQRFDLIVSSLALHYVEDYAGLMRRIAGWLTPGGLLHRTMATLINGLVDAELVVERVVEPIPSEPWLETRPVWRDERRRPMFLLVRARRTLTA